MTTRFSYTTSLFRFFRFYQKTWSKVSFALVTEFNRDYNSRFKIKILTFQVELYIIVMYLHPCDSKNSEKLNCVKIIFVYLSKIYIFQLFDRLTKTSLQEKDETRIFDVSSCSSKEWRGLLFRYIEFRVHYIPFRSEAVLESDR